jgi:hypothetical protein
MKYIARLKAKASIRMTALLSLFPLLCLLSMAGCKSTPEIPEFSLALKELSVPLYAQDGETGPHMDIFLVLLELTEQKKLEGMVEETFYEGLSPQRYGDTLVNAKRDEYRAMVPALKEQRDIPAETLNWEYTEMMEMESPFDNWTVISRSRDYYQGGAHGMTEKKYAVFTVSPEARITLDDLVKKGSEAELQKKIETALRKWAKLDKTAPLSSAGFLEDTVEITDNFFITAKGIGFHWDPYEIAAYAMGPIEVVLPFAEVKTLLTQPIK